MLKLTIFLGALSYSLAFHNFISGSEPKKVYTNYVPPSGERFFTPQQGQAVPAPTAKAVVAPYPAQYPAQYVAPYPYQPQPQYPTYPVKQYPYYPTPFYQPQYYYPGPTGPTPVVFVQRYPAPAEGGNEQGGTGTGTGWGNYWPSNWQGFGNYFGGFPSNIWGGGSEGEGAAPAPAPAEGGAAPASAGTKGKPEKIESADGQSSELAKPEAEKSPAELPEQQYVVLGQPQFFGHFAAFPSDRDPTTLHGAAKGAISSFLFYKDHQAHQPYQPAFIQKPNEIPNAPGAASLAYQRFLLLNKQRSEDGPKPVAKPEPPTIVKETTQASPSNSTSSESSTPKSSSSA